MMKMKKDTIRCVLEIASPVHLGCDEVYEPLGFVVNEQNRQMTVFNPQDFIAALSDEEKATFSSICKKGTVESILEIYQFMCNKPAKGRRIGLCTGFAEHYRKVISLKADRMKLIRNLNQFQISRTAFRPSDNRPYIPGTAVKGAIRTAYLNAMAGRAKLPTPKGKYASQVLQAKLLRYEERKIETDPFRLVKVSDFKPVGDVKTSICYAINKKKKVSDREARGPYQMLEIIEPGAKFQGEISVEKPVSDKTIRSPVMMDALMQSIAVFFDGEAVREHREMINAGISPFQIQKAKADLFIRIGRHSGAESITVAGHRSILIMLGPRKKPAYKSGATTLWLASETSTGDSGKALRPFGWVVFKTLGKDDARKLADEESSYEKQKQALENARLENAAHAAREAERQRLEQEKVEQEAARRRQEEQALAEKVAAMTEEEKAVFDLKDPTVSENRVVEIFNRLDEFSPEAKKSAATAIKAYYIANGKWKVKKKKQKQWQKVQEIKAILGE